MSRSEKHKGSNEIILGKIAASLEGLNYGSVVITVHGSRVVEIDRLEKTRFDRDHYMDIQGGI